MKSLRIAQLAPPFESVPPTFYGGTERVVSWLTEELVRRGHQVTLFASADSKTQATLVPTCDQALRLNPKVHDPNLYLALTLGLAYGRADEFHVIHSHLEYWHLPFTRLVRTPTIGTMHGRMDLPDLPAMIGGYPDAHLVSISHSQRAPLARANWIGNVYHGLPSGLYESGPGDGGYLAFLGRITPDKGVDDAIRIARKAGMPLLIAAKIDKVDRDYYENDIKPLLREPGVEYIGELDDAGKKEFLEHARALLFPIRWPEPFGLVLIESLAAGTPVLALRQGSVPEIVADGVTGFTADEPAGLVRAVDRLDEIDRLVCRQHFDERFSVRAMADAYERLYEIALSQVEGTSSADPCPPWCRQAA
ncbi:MAG: glycosyltransferase family 4 protein [Chloroflexota bacterium]